MKSVGTDPEVMLTRTTVVSLALQALIERLLLSGALDQRDLAAMRDIGLQLAADLKAETGTMPQIGGARLECEITEWSDVIGTPERHANDP